MLNNHRHLQIVKFIQLDTTGSSLLYSSQESSFEFGCRLTLEFKLWAIFSEEKLFKSNDNNDKLSPASQCLQLSTPGDLALCMDFIYGSTTGSLLAKNRKIYSAMPWVVDRPLSGTVRNVFWLNFDCENCLNLLKWFFSSKGSTRAKAEWRWFEGVYSW